MRKLPKNFISLFSLIFLLLTIPAGVYLVQQRLMFFSKAVGSVTVGKTQITGLVLPSVLGFQSDLFSGSSSVSYPIAAPAGLGGLKPNISLSYSSGAVDDNHSGVEGDWKQKYNAQAGLTGFGWSLGGIDSISKDQKGEYYLTIGGASYKLVSDLYDDQGKPTSTNWKTSPEGFLRITHYEGDWGHHEWNINTKDGTLYIFGFDDSSRAWTVETPDPAHQDQQQNVVYRWMLNKIQETHGNTIQFSYEKEQQRIAIDWADMVGDRTCAGKEEGKDYVRAIRPTSITWNNSHYQVQFVWEAREDENLGAIIPGERGGNSCKQTQFTDKRLKEILVKVDTSLLRKYSLSYRYTRLASLFPLRPIVHSLLDRITSYGTDGTTSLPAYTFGYLGDVAGANNNKGNEASLTWANNGYAGKATYAYEQFTPHVTNKEHSGAITPPEATRNRERQRVTQRTTEDGMGNTITTTAQYADNGLGYYTSGPHNSVRSYEFLGFSWAQETLFEKNSTSTIVNKAKKYFYQEDFVNQNIGGVTRDYWYPDPRKGKAKKTEIKDRNDAILSIGEENWAYNTRPRFNEVDGLMDRNYFPFVYLDFQQNTTEGKTTKTTYAYDQYGNTSRAVEERDASISGDERYMETEYYYNTNAWILSKPKLARLYRGTPASGQEINRTGYYYDGLGWGQAPTKGDVTSVDKIGLNPEIHLITRTTYDAYGNPRETTDPKGNRTLIEYETRFNLFPVRVTNALQQTVQTEYDYLLGVPSYVIDINGVRTDFRYDVLGRAKKIIKVGDSENNPTVEYVIRDQIPMAVGTKSRIESGTPQVMESYQFYNGLGQLLQEQSYGPTTGSIIISNNVYNSRGAIIEKPIPYYRDAPIGVYKTPEAALKTITEYDPLGRVIRVTNLDGTFVTTSYSGFTKTAINEAGVKKIFENDAYGNLIQLTEESNSGNIITKYEYDIALGVLKKVIDHKNNQTTISYDSLGRKREMVDPDLGRWQYPKYDANSNLEEQIDAKNQKITFQYDSLNRLTKKIYPDQTNVTYQYDQFDTYLDHPQYGRGKRTAMIDPSGSTATFYDQRGRVYEETKTINVNSQSYPFTTKYTYDNLDRVKAITYPDNEAAQYTYDRAGRSWKLVAGGQTLVSDTTYSALGQLKTQTYGNNTSTAYTYYVGEGSDPTSLRLKGITTTGPAGALFAKTYSYDPVGNITRIAGADETENFTYDKLNRLLGASTAYTASYSYDEIGNILTKNEGPDTRVLSYTSQGPVHAPKTVNGFTYQYDPSGNLIQDEMRQIVYDYENRPISMTMLGTPTPTPTPTGSPPPTLTPTPTAGPQETRRVNNGGPSYTDPQGRVWAADKPYSAGSFGYTTTGMNIYSTTQPIANSDQDTLYQTELWANKNWNYRFDLPNGNYQVTLKFAEIYDGACATGKRLFNVKIQGIQVLTSFDIFATASACYSAVDRSFDTTISDGYLNIDFIKIAYKDTPKVNAIEITPRVIVYDCDFNNNGATQADDIATLINDYDPTLYVTGKATDVNNNHYVNSVDYSICIGQLGQ